MIFDAVADLFYKCPLQRLAAHLLPLAMFASKLSDEYSVPFQGVLLFMGGNAVGVFLILLQLAEGKSFQSLLFHLIFRWRESLPGDVQNVCGPA